MRDQVILLVIGFGLTSVLGGVLGWFFQSRSWSHQHRVQQRDREREQALKVFEEVSSLLDKRLYRMRLVFWTARRLAQDGGSAEPLEAALDEYRAVVATWNDNLNRSLALVHTYFGGALRDELEDRIYEEFTAIGRALDRFVREARAGTAAEIPPIDGRLRWLGRQVYGFNVRALELLQDARLGRDAPDQAPERDEPMLQFGNQGPAVSRLQRALAEGGHFTSRVDGSFGKDTEDAVRDFQREAGLKPDGVVGPATRAKIRP
jgi:hypothetical protein